VYKRLGLPETFLYYLNNFKTTSDVARPNMVPGTVAEQVPCPADPADPASLPCTPCWVITTESPLDAHVCVPLRGPLVSTPQSNPCAWKQASGESWPATPRATTQACLGRVVWSEAGEKERAPISASRQWLCHWSTLNDLQSIPPSPASNPQTPARSRSVSGWSGVGDEDAAADCSSCEVRGIELTVKVVNERAFHLFDKSVRTRNVSPAHFRLHRISNSGADSTSFSSLSSRHHRESIAHTPISHTATPRQVATPVGVATSTDRVFFGEQCDYSRIRTDRGGSTLPKADPVAASEQWGTDFSIGEDTQSLTGVYLAAAPRPYQPPPSTLLCAHCDTPLASKTATSTTIPNSTTIDRPRGASAAGGDAFSSGQGSGIGAAQARPSGLANPHSSTPPSLADPATIHCVPYVRCHCKARAYCCVPGGLAINGGSERTGVAGRHAFPAVLSECYSADKKHKCVLPRATGAGSGSGKDFLREAGEKELREPWEREDRALAKERKERMQARTQTLRRRPQAYRKDSLFEPGDSQPECGAGKLAGEKPVGIAATRLWLCFHPRFDSHALASSGTNSASARALGAWVVCDEPTASFATYLNELGPGPGPSVSPLTSHSPRSACGGGEGSGSWAGCPGFLGSDTTAPHAHPQTQALARGAVATLEGDGRVYAWGRGVPARNVAGSTVGVDLWDPASVSEWRLCDTVITDHLTSDDTQAPARSIDAEGSCVDLKNSHCSSVGGEEQCKGAAEPLQTDPDPACVRVDPDPRQGQAMRAQGHLSSSSFTLTRYCGLAGAPVTRRDARERAHPCPLTLSRSSPRARARARLRRLAAIHAARVGEISQN